MSYFVEEFIDEAWVRIGKAQFEKNEKAILLEIQAEKGNQKITVSVDKSYNCDYCIDDVTINSKRVVAESKKRLNKRQFTVTSEEKKEKYHLKFESAVYSKIVPFLLTEMIDYFGEDAHLVAYNNFIKDYFSLYIHQVEDVEYDQKWCKHYLIKTVQNSLQVISSVYIDEIGMLAQVENRNRIIRE